MTVYSRQIATARRLIARKGQAAIWNKQTEVVNGAQPWKSTAGAPSTYPVVFVRVPAGKDMPFQTLQPGTSVPTDIERFLMAGDVPFTPALNDTISIDGEIKQIKTLGVLQPDGTPILYTFTVI